MNKNNLIFHNDYYKKYQTYKLKYLKLKKQIGGNLLEKIVDTIRLENINQIKTHIIEQLKQQILTDKFLSSDEIQELIKTNNNLIILTILYFIYQTNTNNYYNVFNLQTNYKNYFNNIYQMVLVTKNIYVHLVKYIEQNTHTVLLIPGDSPTYFLFLLEILFPELKTNRKLTIIQFPISGLGTDKADKVINFIYKKDKLYDWEILSDGTKYLKFILDTNLPEHVKNNSHQFVIMDYVEGGKSIVFIDETIKQIYQNQPYRINPNFVRVINLSYYWQKTNHIVESLELFPNFEKKINKLTKINPNALHTLDGIQTYDKIKFRTVFYLDKDFLIDINTSFITNSSYKVLLYIVDESTRRCQYSLRLNEATCLASKSANMNEFIELISKNSNIHWECNLFRILLYLLCKNKEINAICEQLVNTISNKIFSLIVYGAEYKVFANKRIYQGQIMPIENSNELNITIKIKSSTTDLIDLINIFHIDSIELV
jgi:hypothetical protein